MKAIPARKAATLAIWAGLMSFLAFDLILFGNCVIPTQDADPEATPAGRWQAGAGGTLSPGGYLDLRRGLDGDRDIGAHAMLEYLPGYDPSNYFSPPRDSSPDAFHGRETFALGVDMKRVLWRKGRVHQTLQLGLNAHMSLDPESVPSADLMVGYLFGKPRAYVSPRFHLGWQRKPFLQLEVPLGLQTPFFWNHLSLGVGANPAIFLADGVPGLPWIWPYANIEWRFGG